MASLFYKIWLSAYRKQLIHSIFKIPTPHIQIPLQAGYAAGGVAHRGKGCGGNRIVGIGKGVRKIVCCVFQDNVQHPNGIVVPQIQIGGILHHGISIHAVGNLQYRWN